MILFFRSLVSNIQTYID